MDLTETAMQLIAAAGDSKSYSMEAIMHAKDGEFDEARECLAKAGVSLKEAHDGQMDLIGQEVRGENPGLSLLLVHAQDHITMAIVTRDLAGEFVELYEQIKK